MRILVIGAGIGGLATARALTADGHETVVLERAPALRTSGAALSLWSNGTAVLEDLGVSTDGLGAPIDLLEQRAWNGRSLSRIDLTHAAAVHGHPQLVVPRRDLIRRLAEGLPEGTVLFGKECTGVTADGDRIRTEFRDGTTLDGDLLVGADGYRSVVRRHLWQEDSPLRASSWATWQGLSRIGIDTATSRRGLMVVGPEGMCGLMPAGGGLLQWWFDVPYSPAEPLPDSPLAALRRRFGHWASPVREVLEAADEADLDFFPHYRRRLPRTWSTGRAVVLGDAAHPMPPTGGAQGGNQTLEDAWALARALRRAPDVPRALADYQRSRSRQAALAVRLAGTEPANRYHPLLSRLTPGALASRAYTRWLRMVSTRLSQAPQPGV
ncbi:FAD-dependent oxidoreductase [Allostreptomyces psammosilenae]|uniref:FAD-dependent urate hydroxylase n=1 Tax=Allostreptomyces psammosilenae TaxID=1892865 RepID=A0A853A2C0_9ACTN|nr:NAD(P)/FAD-dependent oxidoreductase [Allostreptomyces psammosilenae]NYI04662.1 FAD-dependent urate hydroxylase [Allostreptomyces psammosilenae]